MTVQWTKTEKISLLPPGAVHVWSWMVPSESAQAANSFRLRLSATEIARMERFRFPRDQIRYGVCHANLRAILADYLETSTLALEFLATENGRPELTGKYGGELSFNLSHSKTMGMLAVSRNLDVGVDIEDIRPIEWDVAERHFSAAEMETLKGIGEAGWLDGFFRCWTSKEALLKAEGVGLQIPLHSFDVSLAANQPPALLSSRPSSLFRVPWKLFDVTPSRECRATLAVSETPLEIRRLHFDGPGA